MYMVLSKWEFDPAYEAEVFDSAEKMMTTIRTWPEVEMAFNIRAGANYVIAVMGYSDEDAYQRLVHAPGGPFERAAEEHGIERYAQWIWSERGERQD